MAAIAQKIGLPEERVAQIAQMIRQNGMADAQMGAMMGMALSKGVQPQEIFSMLTSLGVSASQVIRVMHAQGVMDDEEAERRLADMLGVGRAHVRAAFQKLEFYGIVQTFPQSGTVVAQEKMQVLERMITDALQIRQYDFASLVYVRVLLEIEAIKLCARNRTAEDLENIERALEECEAKFYTEERVSKDFAYHQALARGAHNPVIASMLLVITPDVLRYYQRYRVCTVPQEEVYFEHRELLRCVREKDEEGAVAMQRRHLKSLSEFAAAFNDENHFLE